MGKEAKKFWIERPPVAPPDPRTLSFLDIANRKAAKGVASFEVKRTELPDAGPIPFQ